MQKHIKLISCAISGAALLLFAGCGGGGGSAATASANATTTPITTTVVDGAIRNAVVCRALERHALGQLPAQL